MDEVAKSFVLCLHGSNHMELIVIIIFFAIYPNVIYFLSSNVFMHNKNKSVSRDMIVDSRLGVLSEKDKGSVRVLVM